MITVSGNAVDSAEFKQTSLEVAFLKRTIEFDRGIPSKEIACALECSDDTNCLAYDFDQISKCTLMIKIDKLSPGTPQKVFQKVKGKNWNLYCSKS